MTIARPNLRTRASIRAALAAACSLAALSAPHTAAALPYTVVACDSAGLFGYSSAAWTPFGNAGRAYATCPTGGGDTAGISDRLVGQTYGGFSASAHGFSAPPGTTITQVRWAGRLARASCRWGAFLRATPSGSSIIGLPNGHFCDLTTFDNRQFPITFRAPDGTTGLQQVVICGAPRCAPGATMHSHVVDVTVDDPVPPSISLDGPLASGEWVSGTLGGGRVGITATDNSGVRTIRASVGPRSEEEEHACDLTRSQPCPGAIGTTLAPAIGDLLDGAHTLTVLAIDTAGNQSASSREVRVDNTAPDPVAPQVAGGNGWRQANQFLVSWTNPPANAAPVVRAHWRLCASDGNCPASGHQDGHGIQQLPAFSVPAPGEYVLHVWLEDAAGNAREESAAITASLRFDPEPPQLAFEPIDVADPLRVVVNAVDRHSGLASGEIEMRAAGSVTWHGLKTEVGGSVLIAHVDDERFRKGAYEFRAHAVDRAGNEASTGRRTDGSAATIRLPARIDTRLVVGVPHLIVRRRTKYRHGHRRVVRRRIQRLDNNVVARHGRSIRLTGFLGNADGQPIDGATIEALEVRPDGGIVPLGLATTKSDGDFHYILKAARNREILFRYGGSRRIGSASTKFTLLVPADTSIRSDRQRLFNGQQVLFAGRVLTQPLPATGKLIEMQAHFRGRWRTFSTVRAATGGRWRFPYRFGATAGQVTYRFRARLPAEGGYPFIGGNSRVVEVVVVGR
jgi:hypothetical protein